MAGWRARTRNPEQVAVPRSGFRIAAGTASMTAAWFYSPAFVKASAWRAATASTEKFSIASLNSR